MFDDTKTIHFAGIVSLILYGEVSPAPASWTRGAHRPGPIMNIAFNDTTEYDRRNRLRALLGEKYSDKTFVNIYGWCTSRIVDLSGIAHLFSHR